MLSSSECQIVCGLIVFLFFSFFLPVLPHGRHPRQLSRRARQPRQLNAVNQDFCHSTHEFWPASAHASRLPRFMRKSSSFKLRALNSDPTSPNTRRLRKRHTPITTTFTCSSQFTTPIHQQSRSPLRDLTTPTLQNLKTETQSARVLRRSTS